MCLGIVGGLLELRKTKSRTAAWASYLAEEGETDIAFLPLVFFLVTTVFPKDRGLSLVLPDGEALPLLSFIPSPREAPESSLSTMIGMVAEELATLTAAMGRLQDG